MARAAKFGVDAANCSNRISITRNGSPDHEVGRTGLHCCRRSADPSLIVGGIVPGRSNPGGPREAVPLTPHHRQALAAPRVEQTIPGAPPSVAIRARAQDDLRRRSPVELINRRGIEGRENGHSQNPTLSRLFNCRFDHRLATAGVNRDQVGSSIT